MSVNAIDCTGLNPTQIANLKNNGVQYVGRYLSRSTWKGLTVGEVANLKAAGIDIFSIYETNPTKASYFSAATGATDAEEAMAMAKVAGQPEGTAIYFTVDYDAEAGDLPAILAYFKAVQANLNGYKVGAYGSFTVLNYLHQNKAADYWFQTIAWSSGQRCSFLNIYQYQCDKTFAGVNVDFDNLEKSDIGAWGQVQTAAPSFNPIMVVKVLQQTDVRADPSHTSGYICDLLPGEQQYNVIEQQGDWKKLILDNTRQGWVDGNGGKNLYWVNNPALQATQPIYYVVKSGDTLSKIAADNGTTVNQLVAWNGIQNPNVISVGQRIRVK